MALRLSVFICLKELCCLEWAIGPASSPSLSSLAHDGTDKLASSQLESLAILFLLQDLSLTEEWLVFCCPSPGSQYLGGIEPWPRELNLVSQVIGEPRALVCPLAQLSELILRALQNRISPLPLSTWLFGCWYCMYL